MEPKVRVCGFPYLPACTSEKKVVKEQQVMLRVKAEEGAAKGGLPVDLVAVLDVSNSMGWAAAPPQIGGPSRLDVLKKGMKFVISQLRSRDRLAIVAFNDKVVEEYSTEISGHQSTAKEMVDKLEPKGNTANFERALTHAVKILDSRGDKSRVGVIMVVSDGNGQDNDLFKWDDIITSTDTNPSSDPVCKLLTKYPVHTFGLCKAHDPKALFLMAKESNGTYYPITNDLNSEIMDAFAIFLGGLTTIVAINAKVDITSNDTKYKAKVTKIYCAGGYKNKIFDDGTCYITIGILCADEVRDFIFDYEFTRKTTESRTELLYASVVDKIMDSKGNESTIELCDKTPLIKIPVCILPNKSTTKDLAPPYTNVLQQRVRFEIVGLLIAFLGEFHALKKQGADAVNKRKGDCKYLQSVARTMLLAKWEDFKENNKFWKEAERCCLDLGGMNKDITAMASNMKRAMGVACVYSWVSSYQMQRATTTCLLPSTTAFLTESIEAMMETARINKSTDDQEGVASLSNNKHNSQLDRLELSVKLELPAALELEAAGRGNENIQFQGTIQARRISSAGGNNSREQERGP